MKPLVQLFEAHTDVIMENAVKFSLFVLLISLLKFSATAQNIVDEDSIKKTISNTSDHNLSNGMYLYKCCPFGQYVKKGKKCLELNESFDLSKLSVYDKNVEDTGRTVQDVFNMSPGKFDDEDFKEEALVWSNMGYYVYITENGDLMLELPNVYNRWIPVKNANFCIDYPVSPKGILRHVPKVWAIIETEEMDEPNIYLTAATLLSCFFLLLVLVVYFLLPELQNLCGLILMAYVASLFMAFLLLATIQLSTYPVNVCIGLTMFIYYFFISSFCWMSVMSYDIWWTFRGYAKARPIHRRGERFKFLMYCLYAWGLPLFMAIALVILNETDMKHLPWFITPHIPEMGCFLEGGTKMVYLYIPMLILIICNWTFYMMTAFNVWRLSRGTAVLDSAAAGTPAAHRNQWHRFMVYLKLSVVMGLNWLFEIVSFVYPGFKMWYISDTYNILIGLAIFLIFVCKKKIYRKLYKRYALSNNKRFYPGSSKSYSSNNSDSATETVTLQVCGNPKGQNGFPGATRNF